MNSQGTEKPQGAAARRYDGSADPARPRQEVVDPGLFARRLEELFRTVPGPNGRAYSAKAIAARSTERGFRLGESYLSQLRSGKAKSPSFRTVEGIAAAFGEIDLMRLQADTNVQLAAFRLAGLSSDSVTVVNELIKVLREQQGLPKDPPDLMSAGNQDQSADAQRLRVVGGQQGQD